MTDEDRRIDLAAYQAEVARRSKLTPEELAAEISREPPGLLTGETTGRPRLTDFRLVPEQQQLAGSVILTCTDGAEPRVEVSIRRGDLRDVSQARGWGPLKPKSENYLVEANLDTLAPIIQAKYDQGNIAHHTSLAFDGRLMRLILLARPDVERGIRRSSELAETQHIRASPEPNALFFDGERTREKPKTARKRRPPKSVEQRPAAYRFTSTGDKIDVLPEPPAPIDRQLATDTQQELLRKAQELLSRLCNSNSAQRVCDSVQRLVDALDVPFDQLRPGLLLSRVRSLEADRATFDTEDAREELFPDAFAIIDDAVNTARDLLGMFPEVRRVEVERVALDLHRNPNALPIVEQQANEIEAAAQKSEAATDSAVQALARNDAAINAATDPVLRNELVADKLLVIGNFARAAAGKALAELSELGAASWEEAKDKLPKGVGAAALAVPLMGLVALTVWIAGPVIGVAAAVPAWKSLSRTFKKMVGDAAKATSDTRLQPTKGRTRSKAISTPHRLASEVDILIKHHDLSEMKMIEIVPTGINGDWYCTINGVILEGRNYDKFLSGISKEELEKFQLVSQFTEGLKFLYMVRNDEAPVRILTGI